MSFSLSNLCSPSEVHVMVFVACLLAVATISIKIQDVRELGVVAHMALK